MLRRLHGQIALDLRRGGDAVTLLLDAARRLEPLDPALGARHVPAGVPRLQTDYIDLYQVHRPDPATDIEETLSALSDLIHAGKVRVIGTSATPASGIIEAQWAAERRGLERFLSEQPPYSIPSRGIEPEVLPVAQRYGTGILVFGPLARPSRGDSVRMVT